MLIVSGLPRSGTSMMMRVLEKGGLVPIAEIDNPSEANPNGLYEPIGIDYDPDRRIDETHGDCIKVVAPFVAKVNKPSTIIFMTRDLDEIITSYSKYTNPTKWAYNSLLALVQYLLKDKKVIYVNYNEVMKDPKRELGKVKEFIPYFDKAVKVVDKKLYRSKNEAKGAVC